MGLKDEGRVGRKNKSHTFPNQTWDRPFPRLKEKIPQCKEKRERLTECNENYIKVLELKRLRKGHKYTQIWKPRNFCLEEEYLQKKTLLKK